MSFKRRDLSVGEKLAILEAYDLMPQMSQREAAIRLGLSQPLLCRLLRTRYDIESASADVGQHRKRRRTGKDGEVEAALKNWYWEQVQSEDSGRLTGDMLKSKAEDIARNLGKTGFVATNGWFQRWRKRENISTGRSHEDRPSAIVDSDDRLSQKSHQLRHEQQQQPIVIPMNPSDNATTENANKTSDDSQNTAPPKPSKDQIIKQEPAETNRDVTHHHTNRQPKLTNVESLPTADEMWSALDVLRRGVLHYDSANIQIHYTYQDYIENLLGSASNEI